MRARHIFSKVNTRRILKPPFTDFLKFCLLQENDDNTDDPNILEYNLQGWKVNASKSLKSFAGTIVIQIQRGRQHIINNNIIQRERESTRPR